MVLHLSAHKEKNSLPERGSFLVVSMVHIFF